MVDNADTEHQDADNTYNCFIGWLVSGEEINNYPSPIVTRSKTSMKK